MAPSEGARGSQGITRVMVMVGFPSPEEKSTNMRRARAAAGACVPQSGSAFTQLCSEGGRKAGGRQRFCNRS